MSYMRTLLVPGEGKAIAGLFGPRRPVQRALVLSGGGMDSYLAALALRENFPAVKLSFITFDYGQQNSELELEFACRQAEQIAPDQGDDPHGHLIVDTLFKALSKPTALSEAGREAARTSGTEATNQDYVPFRNGRFLATVMGLAESENYDTIVFGAVGSVNPDNSLPFVEVAAAMFAAGAHKSVQIYAPFVLFTKAAVVQFAAELGVVESLAKHTVSCFNATHTLNAGLFAKEGMLGAARQCGVCRSCVSLKQAFTFAQVRDPFYYEVK